MSKERYRFKIRYEATPDEETAIRDVMATHEAMGVKITPVQALHSLLKIGVDVHLAAGHNGHEKEEKGE